MNWRLYLDIARSLRDDASEVEDGGLAEAHYRCAVSRAYYAAYHAARSFVQRQSGSAPRGNDAHAAAWDRAESIAKSNHDKDMVAAITWGKRLKLARQVADYEAYPNPKRDQIEAKFYDASWVSEWIDRAESVSSAFTSP